MSTNAREIAVISAADFAAFCNLAAGAIGIGVLSFPYAYSATGLALGLVMSALFCAINVFVALSLLSTCEAAARAGDAPPSLEAVAARTLGPCAELATITCVLVNQFGQVMACLIVISDLGAPSMASLLGSGADVVL